MHTQVESKRKGVVGISPDSHVSKIHLESREKQSTVSLRAHIPETTTFIGELSPETSYTGKQLLSLLQRWVPRAQAPGVTSHGCAAPSVAKTDQVTNTEDSEVMKKILKSSKSSLVCK